MTPAHALAFGLWLALCVLFPAFAVFAARWGLANLGDGRPAQV